MTMDVEAEVRKNAGDINALTVNVTRLATIVENSEKRHEGDMGMIKEAVAGISRLNEKMTATIGMERDIASCREMMLEQKGDVRTLRHDLNTALNGLQGIPLLSERIAAQGAKIEALETWRDKAEGATGAVKFMANAFWAVFGGAILAGGYFLIRLFVAHSGGGDVGGE